MTLRATMMERPSKTFSNIFCVVSGKSLTWMKCIKTSLTCLRLNKIGKNPHLVSERDTLESDCQQMNDIVAALSAADNDSLDSLPSRCGSLMTLLVLSSSSPASSSSSAPSSSTSCSSSSSQSGWRRAQSHQEVEQPRLECPMS